MVVLSISDDFSNESRGTTMIMFICVECFPGLMCSTQVAPTENQPTVSIILPTYNRAHLISRAIDSILRQSYTNFELIVIDDASEDGTGEVVRSFEDTRLKYVRLSENRGGPAARNVGIGIARGEYVAFQDSDDEWLPSKLALQVDAIRRASPRAGVVYTSFLRVDGENEEIVRYRRVAKRNGDINIDLLRRNFVTTASILVRKECLLNVGSFDEKLPRLQDWELVIRLSKDYEFVYIDEPLLVAHLSVDSISRDARAVTKALELILEKHYEDFKRAGVLADHHYTLSRLMFSNRQYREGLHHLAEGVRRNPWNLKFLASMMTLLPLGQRLYSGVVGVVGR
jgi:glycosyltransferase involved in cell wall biosynthesis